MRIFGFGTDEASPVEAAQVRVDQAQRKHADLVLQLRDIERELAALKSTAIDSAMERGRLDDFSNDEIASVSAGCETLQQAVARAQVDLVDAQTKLAEAKDAADRERSIAAINTIVTAIDEPLQRFLAALADLTNAVKRGADVSLDAKSLLGFLELANAELPTAAAATVTALKHAATLIELGTAPARLPAPETKPAARPAPPPEISCFPLFDIKWQDAARQQRHCGKFWDCGLPVATAGRAIAHGICVKSDDPQAKKLRPTRGAMAADLDRAVCLDDEHPVPPPALPERWINPHGVPRYSDVRQTAGPLAGWIGRPSTTNSEGY